MAHVFLGGWYVCMHICSSYVHMHACLIVLYSAIIKCYCCVISYVYNCLYIAIYLSQVCSNRNFLIYYTRHLSYYIDMLQCANVNPYFSHERYISITIRTCILNVMLNSIGHLHKPNNCISIPKLFH